MSNIDQLKSLASSKLGFARSNQFLVELPTTFSGTTGLGSGGGDSNILCAAATLPGKQILSTERRIGMEFQKVAYGYAVDDVTLSFYLLNDYGTRKYFDEWRKQTLNEAGGIANYKKDYAKDVKIHQLRKPIKNIGIGAGPIRVNIGLGTGSVYSVRLIDAYPTTIQAIELTNDLDGLVQATVQLSYTNWERVSSGQGWISASAGITSGLGDLTSFL